MRVSLIASTVANRPAMEAAGYAPHLSADGPWDDYTTTSADELGEFAGRLCYQSWSRPNPGTATNAGYLANILRQRHFSVLEHASATFLVEDVSRSLTHELVRHRHLSYSQLSQRYVDAADAEFVVPPALRDDEDAEEVLGDAFADAITDCEWLASRLEDRGLPRKRAREAARAVLPNMTATSIVVTGNLRAWREVIDKRNAPGADAEIQELAREILGHLRIIAPNIFQDYE